MVVLRARLWNRVVAALALMPTVCGLAPALALPRGFGMALFVLLACASATGVIRAFNLGVVGNTHGLVVREFLYTRRFTWPELNGATLEQYHVRAVTAYVPVLHLRGRQTVRVHSLSGYRAEIARQRVDTLNALISGRRR